IQPLNYYPLVKESTDDYTLLEYLQDDNAETRPAFFMPDNNAGPDLVFFIKFSSGIEIPVLVQVKLRKAFHETAHALGSIEPEKLYQNANGELHKKGIGISNIMVSKCVNGTILLVIAYPSDESATPRMLKVENKDDPHNREAKHLVGSIDARNASKVFTEPHLQILNALKRCHEEDNSKKLQKRQKKQNAND
ncbi:8677_t:CDS:1, partial [Paraglomus occultum]